jgi:hypothetical protein
MCKWEYCPSCSKKLTFTEVSTQQWDGYEYEEKFEDIGWCENCWENNQKSEFTSSDLYDAYQLDNDIKQIKEDQIE